MNDREGFLAAIIDNPDDDAPRLVYADWLEEHGEATHAELIRVQCEIAAGPDPERREQLWRRLQPIWRRLRDEWWFELWGLEFRDRRNNQYLDVVHFNRGFIDRLVTIELGLFLERWRWWWPRMPLWRIEWVGEADPAAVDLTNCEYLGHVRELHVGVWGPGLVEAVTKALARSPYTRNLRHLEIFGDEDAPSYDEALSESAAQALVDSPYLGGLQHLAVPVSSRSHVGRQLRDRFGFAFHPM